MKETKTMKTKLNHQLVAAVGLLFTLSLQPSTLLAQGSLTPPGAPAPTMKTLQQVEPRVPISSAPFTITQPGSYYLTTNLTVSGGNAITITTNGVTLDLNGFTIASTANPASGVAVQIGSGLRNIAIQNGHIQGGVTNNGSGVFSGPGFMDGIIHSGSAPENVRVSGVSVSGCQNYGIFLAGYNTVVEQCGVRTVGGYGIVATSGTIRGCVAVNCGIDGIRGGNVADSRGEAVGGRGIDADTVVNCYGRSSSAEGIVAQTALNSYGFSSGGAAGLYAFGSALNCRGYSNSGNGIAATTAQNCYGSSGSGTGLYAYNAQNCYGYSSSSGYGLYAERTAIGCSGSSVSGTGLFATTAHNCSGYSGSGTGLYAYGTAIGCYGNSSSGPSGLYAQNANTCTGYRFGGRAIEATIANGCYAISGTNLITYKYNMP